MTEPLPTDPLLDLTRLALWAQERPLSDPEFADVIIESVTVLLRQYGDPTWTTATLPARARDIGYIVAKDYYLNPRQLRQETTGPLQESLNNSVLNGINLTEEQKSELASLAADTPGTYDGIWSISTTRGPVEMHRDHRIGNVIIYDARGGWPVEYLNGEDAIVFQPEV